MQLEDKIIKDPTWAKAKELSTEVCPVPTHVGGLFRSAWGGLASPKEFLRIMGFSRLNPTCLVTATGQEQTSESVGAQEIEQAIVFLGIRFAAIVLATNHFVRMVLKRGLGGGWKTNLEEIIINIEVGYHFGGRAGGVGTEGGALMGFASQIGPLTLLANDPSQYSKYLVRLKSNRKLTREETIELFGCEPYQIAAITIQQYGFGTEMALGVAIGLGKLEPAHLEVSEEAKMWAAAFTWIESLRGGRNYPGNPRMRNFFPEVKPPKPGERNMNLEVLYTEIARVKQSGSSWMWHLPRPSYEETEQYLAAQS